VNLDKYLDTGLFLDHRNTRLRIKNEAAGKLFLNLFAYTGSFTVYAALGGAIYSETVDLSNSYCEWAEKNFKLNNINTKQHIIIRENVLTYLEQTNKQFDLIIIDPPSFSNSKKMTHSFDIQRDHILLITQAMKLLSPNGVLYFSNNLRTFKLANEISEKYSVKDISAQSVPLDFRNKKIHRCWQIKHIQAA
ncbi:MAG: class I SAM-dependent methyltransferase, partial [Neisseriaceae bacterium]|nr:class I SAM-dependent methyltransferase [Neisseriaceae bacterium]